MFCIYTEKTQVHVFEHILPKTLMDLHKSCRREQTPDGSKPEGIQNLG